MAWKLKQVNETEKDDMHNNYQYFNQRSFRRFQELIFGKFLHWILLLIS